MCGQPIKSYLYKCLLYLLQCVITEEGWYVHVSRRLCMGKVFWKVKDWAMRQLIVGTSLSKPHISGNLVWWFIRRPVAKNGITTYYYSLVWWFMYKHDQLMDITIQVLSMIVRVTVNSELSLLMLHVWYSGSYTNKHDKLTDISIKVLSNTKILKCSLPTFHIWLVRSFLSWVIMNWVYWCSIFGW